MPSSSFSSLEKLDKPNKLTHNPVVAYQKLVQEIAYGVWPNKPIVKPYNVYHRPFEFLTTSGQRSAAAAAAAYHILFQLLPCSYGSPSISPLLSSLRSCTARSRPVATIRSKLI